MDFDKDNFEEENELAPLEEEEAGDVDEIVDAEVDLVAVEEDVVDEGEAPKRGSSKAGSGSGRAGGGKSSPGGGGRTSAGSSAGTSRAKKAAGGKRKGPAKKAGGKKKNATNAKA